MQVITTKLVEAYIESEDDIIFIEAGELLELNSDNSTLIEIEGDEYTIYLLNDEYNTVLQYN